MQQGVTVPFPMLPAGNSQRKIISVLFPPSTSSVDLQFSLIFIFFCKANQMSGTSALPVLWLDYSAAPAWGVYF